MKTIQIVFFSEHHRDFDRDLETHRDRDTHNHRDRETYHHRDRECDGWIHNDHYRHHETHRHRDYHDYRDHRTDSHCRDYYDHCERERERGTHHHRDYYDHHERDRGTHHHRDYHDHRERERGHHQDSRVTKVLRVPTKPRSKRRYECRMKIESLHSYVKNLGLTPAELQEKVRKVREARDYSCLLSDERDNSVNGVQENNDVRLYSALTKSLNRKPHQFGAATSKLSKVGRVESVENKNGGSPRSLLGFFRDDVDDDDVPSSRKKGSKRRREGDESAAKKRRICKIDDGDDEE